MIAKTILLLGLLSQINAAFPPGFPQCYRNDPGLNKCLVEATEHPKIRESLLNGSPELRFPKVSPFHIHELTLREESTSFSFRANLSHVLLYGLETYKFTKFDFDVPKLTFFCTFDLGPLYLTADYDVTGKVLLVPITGNGEFTANISKAHVNLVHEVKTVKQGDVEHLAVVGSKTKLKLDDLRFTFKGLLGGNEVLENALQSGLDNSREEIIQEFTPILEETINSIIDSTFGDFFNAHSYDALYPNKQ